MEVLSCPKALFGHPAAAAEVEWLEANRRGGYASSTLAGAHTRRVHGLLAVRPDGGEEPVVLLSKLEETVVVGDDSTSLTCGFFADALHPGNPLLPAEFHQDPFPRFVFANDSFEIQKTLFMPRGENSVVVLYELVRSAQAVLLELRPLVTARSAFDLTRETPEGGAPPAEYGNRLIFHPCSRLPAFQLAHSGARLLPTAHWYRSYAYPSDEPSTPDGTEDLFNPCVLQFELRAGEKAWLTAGTRLAAVFPETVHGWTELERRRREALRPAGKRGRSPDFDSRLMLAADSFVVRRDEHGPMIVKGYPDAVASTSVCLQALPGLLLSTGRSDEARRILIRAASLCREGLLPPTLDGANRAEGNPSALTALWYVFAVERYLNHTGDLETVRETLYPAVKEIVSGLLSGPRACGGVGPDGLLSLGGSEPVRSPRPVEAQALWYNGLGVATFLAHNIESARAAREFGLAARRCNQSFQEQYWNGADGCLYDSVANGVGDPVVRPVQLMVAAFPDSLIDRKQRELVVNKVRDLLLAPMGLRDPDRPGRVVPSWLGAYATAYTLINGRNPKTRAHVDRLLGPLREFIAGRGAGRVPSCFDHDRPAGQIADALATAELVRSHFDLAAAAREEKLHD